MLEVQNLSFSYGKRLILSDISFRMSPGELVFLLGANGAGKSTLFRCILHLLSDYQGKVLVGGTDTHRMTPRELAQKIAYIPQSHYPVFPYSVLDMVIMGTTHQISVFSSPGKQQRELAMDALSQLGMESYAQRSFQRLSGGEQQLVLVARALAQQARILLMDEPTSSLDFGNQARVLEKTAALASQGYAVFLSCHNPQHAMLYAHRVLALSRGKIYADGLPEEVVREELMTELYGMETHFVRTEYGTLIAPAARH